MKVGYGDEITMIVQGLLLMFEWIYVGSEEDILIMQKCHDQTIIFIYFHNCGNQYYLMKFVVLLNIGWLANNMVSLVWKWIRLELEQISQTPYTKVHLWIEN